MPLEVQNPYLDPHVQPDWAQFTRLAGDRAAILFEELRAALGDIEGLREDVHFASEAAGWAPRYRLGEITLFVVRILPGLLEAIMDLDRSEHEALLTAKGVSQEIIAILQQASGRDTSAVIRVHLDSRSQVSRWVRLVKARCRLVAQQPAK